MVTIYVYGNKQILFRVNATLLIDFCFIVWNDYLVLFVGSG